MKDPAESIVALINRRHKKKGNKEVDCQIMQRTRRKKALASQDSQEEEGKKKSLS